MQNQIYFRIFSVFIIFLTIQVFARHVEAQQKNSPATIVFNRVAEPREKAFTLLIPKGWQIDGGIMRINPLTQGGAAQSIAAKLDFTVKKDRQAVLDMDSTVK